MELSSVWRSSYTLRFTPITLVQVLFSAGTVFLLSAVQATSGVRFARQSLSHSLMQAELCIQYLSEIGQSWNCANHICGILGNLLQEQLKPRIGMRHLGQTRQGRRSAPDTNGRTSPEHSDRPKTSPMIRRSMSEVVDPESVALNSNHVGVMDSDVDLDGQLGVDQFLDGLRGSHVGNSAFGGGFGFSGLGPTMLEGQMLSAHPFMPLGASGSASLDPGQFQQWSDSTQTSQQAPWSSLSMPEEDIALQQFWTQQ
jgi:hypothetical protein